MIKSVSKCYLDFVGGVRWPVPPHPYKKQGPQGL